MEDTQTTEGVGGAGDRWTGGGGVVLGRRRNEEELRGVGGWGTGRKGSRERRRRRRRRKKKGKSRGSVPLSWCVRAASHPLAGLFELFALGVDLFGCLHIVLSLLHPLLNVVHQAALRARK